MEGRASGTQARAYATIILLACCPCASALNPSLDINQYAHHAWTVRDGFFKTGVLSIAQTPDGYLWLGTESGLLRFDGVRFVTWQPPAGEQLPSGFVRSLSAAHDGRLWIGTHEGLASWKDGKLTHYPELAKRDVQTLIEDGEGTVWVGAYGAPTGRLCAIRSDSAKCYGEDGGLGHGVSSLYVDGDGSVWAGAETGLWRWKPGPPKLHPMPQWPSGLAQGDNGALVFATLSGIRQLVGGKTEPYRLPGSRQQFTPLRLLRDRNGGLWIGTADRGLLHVHLGRTDTFALPDGLSANFVRGLFEDREGNIWVVTSDGLDHFRDFAVATISVKQGLSNDVVASVLPANDGSVWIGTIDGLNRWNGGQVTIYRKRSSGLPDDGVKSLFQDDRGRIWVSTRAGVAWFGNGRFTPVSAVPGGYVYSIGGDSAGNLWISQDQDLLHLQGESVVEQIPWARLGRKDYALALLPASLQGGVWLGFDQGGVAYFKDGQVRASYSVDDGLGKGLVEGIQIDRDGTLWAATEGGLSRLKNGHVATLTSRNGLPCDTVHGVIEDDDHSFWLYMACGLVRVARPELDAWITDPKRTILATVFDGSDGIRSRALTTQYSPQVAKTADGKLWFVAGDGVGVIDPRHIPYNNLPPPVHIEEITGDRKKYETYSNLHLPPRVRDLEIDYTALSFVAPEKVRFRVKLEGHDADWKDMGTERKAFYNDLPPRHYRLRVKACNNSGVWNEAGASFDFSIAPAYYQTTWFASLVVAAVLAFLALLYHLRIRYMRHQFNIRLEARVGERTRIARDLHDSLLQSFQGVLLKFSTVKYMMRVRPDEAEEALERTIEQAREAITEGRDAVQGLRSSTMVANDLARAITTFAQGLAADHSGPDCPDFRLYVEGKSRDLPPLVRDEVNQIACESLRNSFRHAQARRIEVQIRYDPRQFRLHIVDNGKGIDPAVLSAGGRAGHHGLPGLHERAQLAGGKLSVWSQLNSGTEIDLTIPAAIAYTKSTPARRSMFSGKGAG